MWIGALLCGLYINPQVPGADQSCALWSDRWILSPAPKSSRRFKCCVCRKAIAYRNCSRGKGIRIRGHSGSRAALRVCCVILLVGRVHGVNHLAEADGVWVVRKASEIELMILGFRLKQAGDRAASAWRAGGDRKECYARLSRIIRVMGLTQELLHNTSTSKSSCATCRQVNRAGA